MVCVSVSSSCWKEDTALSIEPEGMLLAKEPPPTDNAESAWTSGPYSRGTFEAGLIFVMSKNGCFEIASQGNWVCSSLSISLTDMGWMGGARSTE